MEHLKSSGLLFLLLSLVTAVYAQQKPVVYTVNYPLQYFAQQIGGEWIDVQFPAPENIDPAFWVPDSETLARYQQADLILLNGAGYARWLNKVSLPPLKMVNTSQSFMDQYITTDFSALNNYDVDDHHGRPGLALITWLDFSQAMIQAHAVLDAFQQKMPELSAQFEQNYARLELDLMNLDRRMKTLSLEHPETVLWTSYPVYQYLARRYRMNLQSVMWKPDVMPAAQALLDLEKDLKKHQSKWMLWEAEPLPESVQALKKLNMESIVFNPCANVPEQGDFISVMKKNVHNLESAFH